MVAIEKFKKTKLMEDMKIGEIAEIVDENNSYKGHIVFRIESFDDTFKVISLTSFGENKEVYWDISNVKVRSLNKEEQIRLTFYNK